MRISSTTCGRKGVEQGMRASGRQPHINLVTLLMCTFFEHEFLQGRGGKIKQRPARQTVNYARLYVCIYSLFVQMNFLFISTPLCSPCHPPTPLLPFSSQPVRLSPPPPIATALTLQKTRELKDCNMVEVENGRKRKRGGGGEKEGEVK